MQVVYDTAKNFYAYVNVIGIVDHSGAASGGGG